MRRARELVQLSKGDASGEPIPGAFSPLYLEKGGLGVTEHPSGGYTVTHLASGFAVPPFRLRKRKDAARLLFRLWPLARWTKDHKALAGNETLRSVLHRVWEEFADDVRCA